MIFVNMGARMETKPCPFCGSSSHIEWVSSFLVSVQCNSCNALGPRNYSEKEAIKEWNERLREDELIESLRLITKNSEKKL